MASSIARAPPASVAPTPIEPRPPAFYTEAANSGVETPAIGACTIGSFTPRRLSGVTELYCASLRLSASDAAFRLHLLQRGAREGRDSAEPLSVMSLARAVNDKARRDEAVASNACVRLTQRNTFPD